VVDLDAAFYQQFLHIAVRQALTPVPPDRDPDHLSRNLNPANADLGSSQGRGRVDRPRSRAACSHVSEARQRQRATQTPHPPPHGIGPIGEWLRGYPLKSAGPGRVPDRGMVMSGEAGGYAPVGWTPSENE
jgi:hypothetical protein